MSFRESLVLGGYHLIKWKFFCVPNLRYLFHIQIQNSRNFKQCKTQYIVIPPNDSWNEGNDLYLTLNIQRSKFQVRQPFWENVNICFLLCIFNHIRWLGVNIFNLYLFTQSMPIFDRYSRRFYLDIKLGFKILKYQ